MGGVNHSSVLAIPCLWGMVWLSAARAVWLSVSL